jgi:NADP-dependent 3-hydroxy acid dehydrogenase YdfG
MDAQNVYFRGGHSRLMEVAPSSEGKVAFVTGASAGIGEATARALASNGADVALVARCEAALSRLSDELEDDYGIDALALPTDVRDYEAVAAAINATVEAFGRLDVVVSNAGVNSEGFEKRMEEMSIADFRRVMEVNVFGMYYVTHAALPHIRASKGYLVFVGSSAAKFPRPGAPVYAGSKWWMRGFALSVEGHVGQDGVGVTLVNPTAVRTQMWADGLDPGEAAEPEGVAAVVAFAVAQKEHTTLSEIDLFRRDILGKFIPAEFDLDLAYTPE